VAVRDRRADAHVTRPGRGDDDPHVTPPGRGADPHVAPSARSGEGQPATPPTGRGEDPYVMPPIGRGEDLGANPPAGRRADARAPSAAERADAGWESAEAGVLALPSGRLVRGRGLRNPMPSGHPPTFGVYLLGEAPPDFGWERRWVRWPDFRLPADPAYLRAVLVEALDHAGAGRVEVACGGGRGRTGTALACLAVLDGVPADEAVAYVRARYDQRAVETPWQKRFVRRFDQT
jgi:hypothetical protein